jgi:hypothetical protein
VQDGSIQRVDLDVSTPGQSVIRKAIAGNGISIGYDGADAGTGDVTVNMAAIAPGSILGNITGAPQPPVPITSWANPSWLTSLAWTKITGVPSFEPALGNPAANGYILSSSAAGARSWIPAPSGGGTITLTGDVTGSGTTSIATTIAANSVGASEIVANSIGASEINNTQDLGLAILQTIKIPVSATADCQTVLGLYRNSSGTAAAGFGSRIELGASSDTTPNRGQCLIQSRWSVAADATRAATMDLFCTQGNGLYGTAVMSLYSSKGVGLNGAADPGAGFVNVPSAGGFKINNVNIWALPDSAQGAPVTTAGTTSTVGVMAGVGQYITPAKGGKVLALAMGYAQMDTVNRIVMGGFRYGTGTKPTHGAATTGTDPGSGTWAFYAAVANQYAPFCAVAVLTGLTVGTQYWFDQWYGGNGGTVKLYSVAISLIEF